jgi:helix-turn-helix, Psq domain
LNGQDGTLFSELKETERQDKKQTRELQPLKAWRQYQLLQPVPFYEQKIQQAFEDLDTQKFSSIKAAAKAHDIPYTTLDERNKGGISKQEARTQQLLSQYQDFLYNESWT